MEDVKKKILDVSTELFLRQGYKKTTTRQIISGAGIKNGSLYHFFRNKEDIYAHLASDLFDEGTQVADDLAEKYMSPALKYAASLAIELHAIEKHDRLAELFYEAYRSWSIIELLACKGSARNKLLFHNYNSGFRDSDYYIRTIAIIGSVYGFISERYFGGKVNFRDKVSALLEMALTLFNVPRSEITEVIKKSFKIIKKKNITVFGFNI